jgi:predicted nucleic acid-binding protein
MIVIVADSGPLISFARIGELKLIERMVNRVLIPPAVMEEIAPRGKRRKGAMALQRAPWIIVENLANPHLLDLVSPHIGRGERAAIALAYERGLGLLIDDFAGRQEAKRLNITPLGSVGLLLEAKKQGVISQVKPLLDALVQDGFRLAQEIYREVLRRANELPKKAVKPF